MLTWYETPGGDVQLYFGNTRLGTAYCTIYNATTYSWAFVLSYSICKSSHLPKLTTQWNNLEQLKKDVEGAFA